MSEIVIVGAGLAGLSAAKKISSSGHDVHVIERQNTVGGRVRTRQVDGFTLDRGFQVLFANYPAARATLDYDALDLRKFSPGAIIAHAGARSVIADPRRDPRSGLATLTNQSVSSTDIIRAMKLWRHLRRRRLDDIFPGADESIESYLSDWGFSQSLINDFIRPFYGGITLDRSLSTGSAVFEYTAKMLMSGEIAVPAKGMAAIPEQLATSAQKAGATISTGTTVQDVQTIDDIVRVHTSEETLEAEAAIVATDPPTARELTDIQAIPTTGKGCTTQYYSLPTSIDLRTKGRLLLNTTDDGPNHIAPMSIVAPEYAPKGKQLLAATYLGKQPDNDKQLAEQTEEALSSWYPEYNFNELSSIHTDRIDFAQFDQSPGSFQQLPNTDDPPGSIYLAGDYTRWSSIQGALESGMIAADAVLEKL